MREKIMPGLFCPIGNKDIRQSFPELNEDRTLSNLSNKKLMFCWNYVFVFGNILNKRERTVKSVKESFGNTMPMEEFEKWKNGNIPEEIKQGIDKFISYDLSSRLKARYMTEKIFSDYMDILDINVKDMINDEDKLDDLKRYTDITSGIRKELPDLLKTMEHNFGVSDDAYNEYVESFNMLDEFHKRERNKE